MRAGSSLHVALALFWTIDVTEAQCLNALTQGYGVFASQPLTNPEALAAGWLLNSDFTLVENGAAIGNGSDLCIPCVGIPYNQGSLSPTTPTTLYFSRGGQISAISVDDFGLITGEGYTNYEATGVWLKVPFASPSLRHRLTVALRADACAAVCDGTIFSEAVITGKAMVNPSQMVTSGPAVNVPIPLTISEATTGGWLEGACIDNMGTHYTYDVCGAASPYSERHFTYGCMLPVTPMYATNGGCSDTLMGFLFEQKGESVYWQGSTQHDPFSLPVEGVCFNTANMVDCALAKSGNVYSTMHMQFINFPNNPYSCRANGKSDCMAVDMTLGGLSAGCVAPGSGRATTNGWSFYPGDGSRSDVVYDNVTWHSLVVSGTPFARFGPGAAPWKGAPLLTECVTVKSSYQSNQCCSADNSGVAYLSI